MEKKKCTHCRGAYLLGPVRFGLVWLGFGGSSLVRFSLVRIQVGQGYQIGCGWLVSGVWLALGSLLHLSPENKCFETDNHS